MWQSPDPVLVAYMKESRNAGILNPQNLSLYAFSYNNPINFVDPDGNSPMSAGAKRVVLQGAKQAVRNAIESRLTNAMYRAAGSRTGKVVGRIGDQALTAVDVAFAAHSGAWGEIGIEFIPIVGDVYSAGTLAKRLPKLHAALQTIERRADLALEAVGNRGKLRGAIGLKAGDNRVAHHLVPIDVLDEPVVQKALEGGFKFNGAENGLAVAGQAGGHTVRNARIRREITDWAADNPDASPAEAADFLRSLARDERADIGVGGFVTNE